MQEGSSPDHCASAWQYLVDACDALYPSSHVYVVVLPKVRPELSATLPLAGLLKLGHDNAKYMKVTE